VFKWRKNAYRNAKPSPVTNQAMFEELDELVTDLNELGVEVLF
jgi:ribonuclease HI